jgi:hypothetical protein
MARAQGVGDIPADAHKNDILGKMRDYSIFTGFWYGSRGAFVV